MGRLITEIKERAKKLGKHIVLAEGEDVRIVEAASILTKEGICKVTILGNQDKIKAHKFDLSGVNIVDPKTSDSLKKYSALFYELRKEKGVTQDAALLQAQNNLYFGVLMVKSGDADGMVAGAINSTGDVLRPALQIIKTAKGIKTVSSCFIMEMDKTKEYTDNGILVFGDCAVNINPNSDELASIAISTADSAKKIAGISPRVAMLSFSTMGSAKHELVDKVVEATKKVKEIAPEILVDGELQADAALVASVGKLKSPNSPVAGQANVLIFPDLQAGNIGYKLVQRLACAEAIGPICQGMALPVNDLSRGCSADDVVAVAAITSLQS